MVRLRSGNKTRNSDANHEALPTAASSSDNSVHKVDNQDNIEEDESTLKRVKSQKDSESTEEPQTSENDVAADDGRNVLVHRCNFVDLKPESIESFASNGSWLALGRQTGSIELWECVGSLLQPRFIIPGSRSQVLRSITWQENRLFGGNLDGTIFEVDLISRIQAAVESSGGGGIWSLDSSAQFIASACEDGKVRLYKAKPASFGVDASKVLSGSANGRLLCVKFHNRVPDEFLFTSGMDAMIRKWSIKQRRVIDQIAVPSLSRSISIWSLDTFGDTVACGDSLGRVHIWGGSEEGALQTFSEHRADILSVKFSADGKSVFASGIDPRVAVFRFVQGKWIYAYSHRGHTHDVRAVGIVISGNNEIVCSGGVDAHLITYPVGAFERARPWKNSPFPQRLCAKISKTGFNENHKVVLVLQPFHVDLWQVNLDLHKQTHLAIVKFDGDRELRCADMSEDASLLAVADDIRGLSLMKMTLNRGGEADLEPISFSKLDVVGAHKIESNSVRSLAFCETPAMLAVGTVSKLFLVDLEELSVVKEFSFMNGPLIQLVTSRDNQWLAAVECGATFGAYEAIEVFNLDAIRLHGTIPGSLFKGNHAAISFSDNSSELIVARSDGSVCAFRVEEALRVAWEVRIGPGFSDLIIGIACNPADPDAVVAWSWSALVTIRSKGPKQFQLLRRFKPIIHAEFLSMDTLMILESPFVQALKHLPDVIERERYGT